MKSIRRNGQEEASDGDGEAGELDRYVVVNGQGVAYLVDHVSGECTCPDSQLRCPKLGIVCKHAMAVELYVAPVPCAA